MDMVMDMVMMLMFVCLGSGINYEEFPPWRQKMFLLVTHDYFDLAIAVVIGINVLCMAMEHYNQPEVPYHTIPYHTIPYHTIPYHTIPYHTIPYHTIPYHTIPYHTIPYHTIPYHTIPYHTIPHHTIPHHTISYHTTLHHTTPCTIPYHTISYHTKPCGFIKYTMILTLYLHFCLFSRISPYFSNTPIICSQSCLFSKQF